jgi:hypothetical protein
MAVPILRKGSLWWCHWRCGSFNRLENIERFVADFEVGGKDIKDI